MRLAANLSWMYRDLDWTQRFDAAARDGFAGVEILLPYEQTPAWYAARLREAGLQLALINTPIDADAAGPGRPGPQPADAGARPAGLPLPDRPLRHATLGHAGCQRTLCPALG